MAPHDWVFVIGIAVIGVAELVISVAAWRARATYQEEHGRRARVVGSRFEESARSV